MRATILIVEDEAPLARNIKSFLDRAGYDVAIAETLQRGIELYGTLRPEVMLIDHNLPDGTGLELIRKIRRDDRDTKLVMTTAHGGVQVAVDAMKSGADDYMTKPVSLDEMGLVVERLLAQVRMADSLSYYHAQEKRRSGIDHILGASPAINDLRNRIAAVIAADERLVTMSGPAIVASAGRGPVGGGSAGAPVLILGETGTGKELIARALHFDGPRRDQPFIEINCAALPSHLVESELFGHERGAFTDARERKSGLFQAAEGGTLFLDEIGEFPLAIQSKMLKALEDKAIRSVGSVRDRKVDVRIVAATNASLDDKVRSGEFRSDLYYRLSTISIVSPPLRDRGDDALILADAFLAAFRRRYERPDLTLDGAARAALLHHRWPGNVRELRNVIEQATMLCVGNRIGVSDLSMREPPPLTAADPQVLPPGTSRLPDMEREMIVRALRQHRGNVTLAARELGVSRDTLRYRMERLALQRDEFR